MINKMLPGNKLVKEDREYVLRAYTYRHTGDHISPGYKGLPLQFKDDEDWLKNSRFHARDDGRLDRRFSFCASNPTWPDNPELRRK